MANKFDRFTERARRTLTLAHEEAQRFNHNYIGTEHLLLGLIREGDGLAARVLSEMGIQLPKVRSAVEFIIGRGDNALYGDMGLTPRAKKVIELADDEARRLNHHYIGTEHLLLGLVREGGGIAAGVLESLGVSLERVRMRVLQIVGMGSAAHIDGETEPTSPEAIDMSAPKERVTPFNPRAKRALTIAEEEVRRFNHPSIGTEHLLLGLVREWDGVAARLLWDRGVRLHQARQAVALRNPRRDEVSPDELYLTRRANGVLALAVEQARRLKGRAIGTEHLLLGLIRDESSTGSLVIADLSVDTVDMRTELIRIIARASDREDASIAPAPIWGTLVGFDRFTARARKTLVLAESEAHRFHHDFIGTEHLLLGIITDEDSNAAQLLANLGTPPQRVRFAVENTIRRGKPVESGEPAPNAGANAAIALAVEEAQLMNQDLIGPEHLLLGLIRKGEGIAAAVLERLGVRLDAASDEVRRIAE